MTNNKKSTVTRIIAVLLLALTLFPQSSDAQRHTAARTHRAAAGSSVHPKLVVIIMIDQCRYDFIERFWDLFGDNGFRRLVNDGAFFTNANFDYVPTVTAAGHAAVHTGSVPALNGIVGNYVFDPASSLASAEGNRPIVADKDAHPVGTGVNINASSASPRALIGTTLGDQLRLSNNMQSRVVAISQKDRAAILPGGQRPNGAYWFNGSTGEFISSDYYFREPKQLPGWVKDFNKNTNASNYFKSWTRVMAPGAYDRAMAAHIPAQQQKLCPADVKDCSFPYAITKDSFEFSPFASEYLADFAKAAISGEALGRDSHADLLAISFSQPDLLGHFYGPDSQEIEDTYIRLDRTIADLMQFIDRRVGLQNTIIALTADHGVAPIPEYMDSLGFNARVIKRKELDDAVNSALKKYKEDRWVIGFTNDQLFLDRKLIEKVKADPAEVERRAAEAALSVAGIANAFTRTQILEGSIPAGKLARRIMNGYQRALGGDVWIITKPFWFVSEGVSTTHGSPYHYDTHVPVILYGAGVKAGRYAAESTPSDIAPTIAALLGIEAPSNSVGRVLVEALKEPARGAR